jgi:hypothetical protein
MYCYASRLLGVAGRYARILRKRRCGTLVGGRPSPNRALIFSYLVIDSAASNHIDRLMKINVYSTRKEQNFCIFMT